MRIQHNISALNSHRNLGINNNFTGKNLEKLSSGYRINRAGDDAAGLAISEKMRGQIRGLAMAEQNTLNGISLIQTAEGGLNETHAILQRMRELAVQSSNGTYDEAVDRVQLDKEFQTIKSEIDRIASSTHYNGIKLLDGSLGAGTKTPTVDAWLADGASVPIASATAAVANVNTVAGLSMVAGDYLKMEFQDANGKTYTMTFTATDPITNMQDLVEALTSLGSGATEAQKAFLDTFSVAGNVVTAKNAGDGKGQIDTMVLTTVANPTSPTAIGVTTTTAGKDEFRVLDLSVTDLQSFALDGKKFQFVEKASDAMAGYHAIVVNDLNNIDADANVISEFLNNLGYRTEFDGTELNIYSSSGMGLVFQIGANGGADQRVRLNVDAMDSRSIGIYDDETRKLTVNLASTDIKTIEGANNAIDVITGATNMVSSQRAGLGALQNRLEHTMNNLGVSKENLTAAESVIRDVDMAKEMMEFTKNQILVQASQAMLAQANQLPQGVLSLLR